jgi:hypothetical protein
MDVSFDSCGAHILGAPARRGVGGELFVSAPSSGGGGSESVPSAVCFISEVGGGDVLGSEAAVDPRVEEVRAYAGMKRLPHSGC